MRGFGVLLRHRLTLLPCRSYTVATRPNFLIQATVNTSHGSGGSKKFRPDKSSHVDSRAGYSTQKRLFGRRSMDGQGAMYKASQRLAAIFEADGAQSLNPEHFQLKRMEQVDDAVEILWGDGHKSIFHHVWLRDNCRCVSCHHPHAEERTLDTFGIELNVMPHSVQFIEGSNVLRVVWPAQKQAANEAQRLVNSESPQPQCQTQSQQPHVSEFSLRFLRENCYTPKLACRADGSDYDGLVLWRASEMASGRLPSIRYADVMSREDSLIHWLELIRLYGFAIVTEVPADGRPYPEMAAQRISFLRTTFWGDSWSVRSEPNPRNLSLTGGELYPHTDFTWSETPPGLQFLHCVEFKGPSPGGESTLADGYAIAEHLRRDDPEAFRLLREVPIRHYFSGANESYSYNGTTIRLDKRGLVQCVRFNQANRAPLDTAPGLVRLFYRALNKFAGLTRSKEFLLSFRLREGEMLVFNNHRMLHGRLAYDAKTTTRHLKGCYLDLEQFESKYSILSKMGAAEFRANASRQDREREEPIFQAPPPRSVPAAATVSANVTSTRQYSTNAPSYGSTSLQSGEKTKSAHFDAETPGVDAGFERYNDAFIERAVRSHAASAGGSVFADGSRLRDVVQAGQPSFTRMADGTIADYTYQCALFQQDIKENLSRRLVGLLRKLEGEHIRRGTGARVDLFEHSVQAATRARRDCADDEMVVVALLHDIGEMMSPLNHGEIAAAILRPYISPDAHWILAHHEIFQGYYYFHHVGGDRNTREMYRDHANYAATVDFCERWDQCSFDPDYESMPIAEFEPLLERVLQRQPYWHFRGGKHPKLGVVTIQAQQDN